MERIMMRIANAYKHALFALAAAGMLTACGGGAQPALTPFASQNAVAMPAGLSREKIGYVENFYSNKTDEFRFPKGQPIGSVTLPGGGMCSRTNRGTFWVTLPNGPAAVEEFKVGGTSPIRTLGKGGALGCSIDEGTGDLAVAGTPTGIEIFKHARGPGKRVGSGASGAFYLGYDDSDDLFVDSAASNDAFELAELPAGGSTFTRISLPNVIEFPGSVQWDGTYITVADQEGYAIYGYSISGSTATLERTVSYSGASDCADLSIYKGKWFICADAGDNNAKVYAYPAGGAPRYTWSSSGFDEPLNAIVVEK